MNNTIANKSIPTESSVNLPLVAYAISKFDSVLVSSDTVQGKIHFTIVLKPGTSLPQIERDFNSDGQVGGLNYSRTLKHLKGIVVKTLSAQNGMGTHG